MQKAMTMTAKAATAVHMAPVLGSMPEMLLQDHLSAFRAAPSARMEVDHLERKQRVALKDALMWDMPAVERCATEKSLADVAAAVPVESTSFSSMMLDDFFMPTRAVEAETLMEPFVPVAAAPATSVADASMNDFFVPERSIESVHDLMMADDFVRPAQAAATSVSLSSALLDDFFMPEAAPCLVAEPVAVASASASDAVLNDFIACEGVQEARLSDALMADEPVALKSRTSASAQDAAMADSFAQDAALSEALLCDGFAPAAKAADVASMLLADGAVPKAQTPLMESEHVAVAEETPVKVTTISSQEAQLLAALLGDDLGCVRLSASAVSM